MVSDDEVPLVKRMLELVKEFPRFGYRQIGRLLRHEGFPVNIKRIYRLWRREGLKVPQKKLKQRRLGDATGGITRRQAEHKDHVWSVDFIFDWTANGRALKILSVIDEYTRECLALEVGRKLHERTVDRRADGPVWDSGAPRFIRSDNGPEFISRRLRSFLEKLSIGTSYIEPGSPWQNGYVESFHSRFRDSLCVGGIRDGAGGDRSGSLLATELQPPSSSQFAGGSDACGNLSSRRVVSVSEQASATPQPAPALQQPTADPFTQPLPS